MLVPFVKFIHLLMTLGLLGLTFHCVTAKGEINLKRINLSLLFMCFFAIVTGTLLVHPKHFTFHTPWIQAAYFFVMSFFVCILAMFFLQKKINLPKNVLRGIYLVLFVVLVLVMHDAVVKGTVISFFK